jgi:riboflavin kinase/FMN adenylyltransferase
MKDMKPITLSGIVTRFQGNGRKLGYPTANLTTQTGLADGVYFGFADLAEWSNQPAVIFIGTPTTMGDKQRRVEAHLFDIPDKDYYDQTLNVSLRHYHRANRTFKGVDELMEAMRADETAARQWLATAA